MWWPGRRSEDQPLNEQELQFTEHEWDPKGCMQWAAYNELKNSSTRCEAGAARGSMQKEGPAHIGVDNQTTVIFCTNINNHQRRRWEVIAGGGLRSKEGGSRLGGSI